MLGEFELNGISPINQGLISYCVESESKYILQGDTNEWARITKSGCGRGGPYINIKMWILISPIIENIFINLKGGITTMINCILFDVKLNVGGFVVDTEDELIYLSNLIKLGEMNQNE